MRKMQQGLSPCKDDKPKYAEIIPFQAGSDCSLSAMVRGAVKVQIYGFLSLPDDLREYCAAMLEVFDDVHKSTPNVTFEIVS